MKQISLALSFVMIIALTYLFNIDDASVNQDQASLVGESAVTRSNQIQEESDYEKYSQVKVNSHNHSKDCDHMRNRGPSYTGSLKNDTELPEDAEEVVKEQFVVELREIEQSYDSSTATKEDFRDHVRQIEDLYAQADLELVYYED